ncbi:ABC transporter ATP-binding protein [Bifidobacterium boum]|uniref:ABC transporter ATP-binding protein n=1 Tax=Bifidobacterium boum TaxID=78343 RepID=A0A848D6D1_9BIFI|nr:ABC transporter ATP-binding protein [Bifidobacterium boum]NMF01847.1 ABC transporter ATP-binding protein [Bifidobacterium boum]
MASKETAKKEDDRPVVLSVQHVAKSFRLPTEQATGLKMAFLNWTKGVSGFTEQKVLRDISFEVKQGDFFGIVGRNGSGKSTLLKIISGIYVPDKGTVTVNGKLVSFIELGVGFNPELTGRENVYLNGALLGFTRDEIDAMYDDIVDFAELGDFMDQKLKNYSSGMQVRLAFSVAIKAQGDILVLDEVLAVGDEAFQRKCDNFFTKVKKDSKKTVILVTHSMDAVKRYCNNAILIKDGMIIASGDKDKVADQYTLENIRVDQKHSKPKKNEHPEGLNDRVPVFRITPVSETVANCSDPFLFDIEYQYDGDDGYIAIAMNDIKRGGIPYDSGQKNLHVKAGHHVLHMSMPLKLFNNGEFRLVGSFRVPNKSDEKRTDMIAYTNDDNSLVFAVRDSSNTRDYALLNDSEMHMKVQGYDK